MRHATIILPFALFLLAQPVYAQSAPDQAQSLKGAETVSIAWDAELRNNRELYNSVTLELRKAGLRIEADGADLRLGFSFVSRRNITSVDADFRMDVQQSVIVSRTDDILDLVTWYHEHNERISNIEWSDATIARLVTAGVNQFLLDYLTANGR